jgi:hypothetical protein
MENAYRYLYVVFAAFILGFCFPAQSAYQYTYTSAPFDSVDNTFIRGQIYNISTDSFLKIVITSATLLKAFDPNPLANATYDFNVEGFNHRVMPDTTEGNTLAKSDLIIRDIGQTGLPTSWYLAYQQTNLFQPGNSDQIDYIETRYFSDNLYTNFSYTVSQAGNVSFINAEGLPGTWTLNEINSPVPENETYALLLAGLGVVGYLVIRKRKESSYLKMAKRSKKRTYAIRRLA